MNIALPRRSRPRWLGFVLFALTVALAAALVSLLRPKTVGTPFGRTAPEADRDPDELGQLRNEVKLLRRQLQTVATQTTTASPGTTISTPLAATGSTARITPAEAAIQDRKHFENLEKVVGSEAPDLAWAGPTERLIGDRLKDPVFTGSKLVSSSCRSTVCRIEVAHDNESHRRRFRGTFPNRLSEFQSGTMRRGSGPSPSTVVYVAREGHQLPRAVD